MDAEKSKGYKDQEILINAIAKLVSQRIHRSELMSKATLKQAISEWSEKNDSSLKEIKTQDENRRSEIVNEIIDILLDKVGHTLQGNHPRQKLKMNILQVYEKWKLTIRTESDIV